MDDNYAHLEEVSGCWRHCLCVSEKRFLFYINGNGYRHHPYKSRFFGGVLIVNYEMVRKGNG